MFDSRFLSLRNTRQVRVFLFVRSDSEDLVVYLLGCMCSIRFLSSDPRDHTFNDLDSKVDLEEAIFMDF